MRGRRILIGVAMATLLAVAGAGLWQAAGQDTPTPIAQVDSIAETLRCPTCQGLSVADSAAPIASSMRDIIGEQVDDGRTPAEIRAYFVERYGEWILLSPRPSGLGWIVWGLPVVAVLTGGAVALRRARRPAVHADTMGLEQGALLIALHKTGQVALPQTPAGDRLEAALDAVSDSNALHTADGAPSAVPDRQLMRVAGALAAQRREAQPPAPTAPANRPSATGRRIAWVGGAATFGLLIGGLLFMGISPRGADGVLTGTLPSAAATSAPATEGDLEALREDVAQNPTDLGVRLRLASRLLQSGRVAQARNEARIVLDQRPDQPDGLLLLGLAMVAQDDPTAPQTLQRYLDSAPADHSGIPLARSLIDPSP